MNWKEGRKEVVFIVFIFKLKKKSNWRKKEGTKEGRKEFNTKCGLVVVIREVQVCFKFKLFLCRSRRKIIILPSIPTTL